MTGGRVVVYPTRDELFIRHRGRPSAAERLRTAFTVEPNGCWRWTGSITTSGYGHLSIGNTYYQAHRLMYVLFMGRDIPAGLEPDHLCRNRWCVNPVDIEAVTHAVNMQRSARAILSREQADAIRLARRNGAGVRALARQFGVNHATVSRLVNGLTWPEPTIEATVAA